MASGEWFAVEYRARRLKDAVHQAMGANRDDAPPHDEKEDEDADRR